MNRRQRILLGCIVPVLSILYATGEYLQWWEHLSGRYLAVKGVERLSSSQNYPTICVFADQQEFRPLLNLILSKTSNLAVVQDHDSGRLPSAIIRVGGPLRPQGFDGNVQPDLANPDFIPDSSPVVLLYGYDRKDYPKSLKDADGQMVPIGQLQDLHNWIRESRDAQRFLMSTVLIGILSVIVVVLDVTKISATKKKDQETIQQPHGETTSDSAPSASSEASHA